MVRRVAHGDVARALVRYAGARVPGLQYLIVQADRPLFEYAGGWADLRNRTAMTLDTTLMGYSMTKTITAVAVLQLVERQAVALDDPIARYLPQCVYAESGVTVRQLLAHTSGVPNPIPLRWVHLVEDHERFDEDAALARVQRRYPKLAFEPGEKFAYSNIGYWLLGKIVERVTARRYTDHVRASVLTPLGLSPRELDFEIADPATHAKGYLAKYTLLNCLKGLVTDRKFWGGYEGRWLAFRSHYLDGPAFGGLVGTAKGFGRFLQDQLQPESVLLAPETKRLLETRQQTHAGKAIPMTLGWHVAGKGDAIRLFKEGGGGGFHGEMRLYPAARIGSVVLANSTTFDSSAFLNRFDRSFGAPS